MKRSPVISATTEQEGATAAASQPIFHRRGRVGLLTTEPQTDYEPAGKKYFHTKILPVPRGKDQEPPQSSITGQFGAPMVA